MTQTKLTPETVRVYRTPTITTHGDAVEATRGCGGCTCECSGKKGGELE